MGRLFYYSLALLVLTAGSSVCAQIIEPAGNGLSYIWNLTYGASGLNADGDADGDGVSNGLESIAGTNPFDSNSVPRIAQSAYLGTSFRVTVPSVPGKSYQLQSSRAVDSTVWTNESSLVATTGVVITLTAPLDAPTKFFRVIISDVDSDGDGLTDWEERLLGLDPSNPFSNGQFDGSGQPLGDRSYTTNRLASQNIITIVANNPRATVPDADPATDTGSFTISRGGFPLNSITVPTGVSGTAVESTDYAPLSGPISFPVGVGAVTKAVIPLASSSLQGGRSVTMTLQSGGGYSVGPANTASVVIYPSQTPSGTGLTGQYYNGASLTYNNSANFNPANLKLTRVDPVIDVNYGTGSPAPSINTNSFTIRWTGQIQPQYSETYTFYVFSDEGVKLYINGQLIIDKWVTQAGVTNSGSIDLQAGVRYNLQLDYFENTGGAGVHFYWNSASQPLQVVPSTRLYPSAAAPPAITSPATALAFLYQPFSYVVVGSNQSTNPPTRYQTGPLPPGLTFSNTATNGVISGIPTASGDYPVLVSATNSTGTGVSLLDILVVDTGNAITREIWTGVPGTSISDIPVDAPPTSTTLVTSLAGTTDFGDDYGERVRGYITAPLTGNYYFWIAASNSAELWISNDGEPANKVKRASVINGTSPLNWATEPNQKSPWLALIAGQRYYVEVLHKAGTGSGDNVAVGWLRPDQAGSLPSEVVPGWVLSPYVPPVVSANSGTLYAATMLAEAGAQSSGVGTATLRVSADETQAILRFSYTNLSSPFTGEHVHSDPYLNHPSQIIFDIDTPPAGSGRQPDGTYLWKIEANGGLSAADIVEIIKEGKAYINIHTVANPNGEIRGNFTLANGSTTFTAPPPPPTVTDDHTSLSAAARFLTQSTFGPSPADISLVQSIGYSAWIDDQLTNKPVSHQLPYVLANPATDPTAVTYSSRLTFNSWWQNAVTAPDQLRQRVAFALSEILVVSDVGPLNENARALSDYYDTLVDNAFRNFRDILKTVTLSPAMGIYLDMRANDKGDQISGRHPNENYAREIMQLFSIGLNRMWPDGTLVLDSKGSIVPTYDQNVIMGYSRVFTGWNYYQTNQANGRLPSNFSPGANFIDPMTLVPTHHELGTKRLLDNIVLPAATGNQADPSKPEYDTYGLQDLEAAHDAIFNNQNVGPFICRQLIQRLVTSNPSREYLYRVVQKFNDNGSGVRGDMSAVIKAILLDYEARDSITARQPTYGKQREPLLRVTTPVRAFPPPAPASVSYAQTNSRAITITTPGPHRLTANDNIVLQFNSGGPLPTSATYPVASVISNNIFTVNATGLASGSYTQIVNTATSTNVFTDTNGVTVTNIVTVTNYASITVTISGHGLVASNYVYLALTTGGGVSGPYYVVSVPDAGHFVVTNTDTVRRTGSCIIPKLAGGFSQTRTNITVSLTSNHSLNAGDMVYLVFPAGTGTSGQYQVISILDAKRFTVRSATSTTQTQPTITVFPLVAPPLVRSGNVTFQFSTWNMGTTDGDLTQTPLRSPTVFNFFLPEYKFPGLLASAGLTTPEFQLTSDTEVANQMNFLYNGIYGAGNLNGFCSFKTGSGAIVLDLGPYMTQAYTDNTGIPNLVDTFNSLLCGGQLSSTVKTYIVNYGRSLAYTTPTPTTAQILSRVRGVVHLILTSPDFTIQK